jgi:hypothetical protein
MRVGVTTAAVALLVLLAGCSGIPGVGTDTGTETPGTDTNELDALPGGIDNVSSATVDTHQQRLADAGSYTTDITLTVDNRNETGEGQNLSLTQQFQVDLESDTSLMVADPARGLQSVYTDGNTTFVQAKASANMTNAEAQYAQTQTRNLDTKEASGATSMIIEENITYNRIGTETYNGAEVVRFEADENRSRAALERMFAADSKTENVTVTEFSSTILVGTDGVVRHYDLSYTAENNGQTVTTAATIDVSNVGATTVTPPEWLEHAQNSTSQA